MKKQSNKETKNLKTEQLEFIFEAQFPTQIPLSKLVSEIRMLSAYLQPKLDKESLRIFMAIFHQNPFLSPFFYPKMLTQK